MCCFGSKKDKEIENNQNESEPENKREKSPKVKEAETPPKVNTPPKVKEIAVPKQVKVAEDKPDGTTLLASESQKDAEKNDVILPIPVPTEDTMPRYQFHDQYMFSPRQRENSANNLKLVDALHQDNDDVEKYLKWGQEISRDNREDDKPGYVGGVKIVDDFGPESNVDDYSKYNMDHIWDFHYTDGMIAPFSHDTVGTSEQSKH